MWTEDITHKNTQTQKNCTQRKSLFNNHYAVKIIKNKTKQ